LGEKVKEIAWKERGMNRPHRKNDGERRRLPRGGGGTEAGATAAEAGGPVPLRLGDGGGKASGGDAISGWGETTRKERLRGRRSLEINGGRKATFLFSVFSFVGVRGDTVAQRLVAEYLSSKHLHVGHRGCFKLFSCPHRISIFTKDFGVSLILLYKFWSYLQQLRIIFTSEFLTYTTSVSRNKAHTYFNANFEHKN
jgi:hypothetical protein